MRPRLGNACHSAVSTIVDGGQTVPRIGSRSLTPFVPPAWASPLKFSPKSRLPLAHLPTPLVQWQPVPEEESPGTTFWLKRDDLSGSELSGNKVRKLEFLLGEAINEGADCVITCGGLQSNNCRAVAVAAKSIGLDCHLVLRLDRSTQDTEFARHDFGFSGNLLINRMVGAKHYFATVDEYRKLGGPRGVVMRLHSRLVREGRRPYIIPLGGSDALGTWGFLQAFDELAEQAASVFPLPFDGSLPFSDIVLATGSGGTLAGVSLANRLAESGSKVWAFCASDTPAWCHKFIDDHILSDLLPKDGPLARWKSSDLCEVREAKNLGYGVSSLEELRTIRQVARDTGVILDPVYTGKAMHKFMHLYRQSPGLFGKQILFWHTGGSFALWDKQPQLAEMFASDPCTNSEALVSFVGDEINES